MNDHLELTTTPQSNPLGVWNRRWAAVPPLWRGGCYQISQPPFSEVFTQNSNYPPDRFFDFRPGGNTRLGQELAWWVYSCWHEGLRKVEPSMLRWWQHAVTSLATSRENLGLPVVSLAELPASSVVKEATLLFHQRNGRFPSAGNLRNLRSISEHVHLFISARTTDSAWWSPDLWSLRADDRIPRRPHEPVSDLPVNLRDIEPIWLREGLRFYFSRELIHQRFTWTTLVTRSRNLRAYFGRFLLEHMVTSPVLAQDPETLRTLMTEHLSWLRSPAATTSGRPLSTNTVAAVQSAVQSFYDYMFDNSALAAHFTADPRWGQIRPEHTRLWPPTSLVRSKGRQRQSTPQYITAEDLATMAACMPVLMTPTTSEVTIDLPGKGLITTRDLGDPQAARAWLIQAATGRRASEVLMMDYQCLTPVPGVKSDQASAFVARMQYQQTKVDGVDPTILIEQYVVDLIQTQQQWVRNYLGRTPEQPDPPHLFVTPRQNYQGLRPRSYSSHSRVLSKLNSLVALKDQYGNPLNFTATHRLRHSRATELLNAGVPVHVVQDYLGHRSPEMTMHYARTLAKVAESEFLKAAATGAFGQPLEVSQRDTYQIAQLEGRTDRVLPNGQCMLPPTQTCDRGNACLTCASFATDASHLDTLTTQRKVTVELITDRQTIVEQRHGRPMSPDNAWLKARQREVDSLERIIDVLSKTGKPVKAPGTSARKPVTPSHHAE